MTGHTEVDMAQETYCIPAFTTQNGNTLDIAPYLLCWTNQLTLVNCVENNHIAMRLCRTARVASALSAMSYLRKSLFRLLE
jgi:hypothetical protein